MKQSVTILCHTMLLWSSHEFYTLLNISILWIYQSLCISVDKHTGLYPSKSQQKRDGTLMLGHWGQFNKVFVYNYVGNILEYSKGGYSIPWKQ